MSKTEKFLQYIQESKSKSTFKQYRLSINLFTTYYNETHETSLTSDDFIEMRKQDFLSENVEEQRRFYREIEKFHKWMLEGSENRENYSINSARNMTLGIIQLFKYYGFITNVSFPMVVTTKDYVPTIQQYRDMFNVADLRGRVILSMGLDLGWRIGDFLKIKKDNFDLNRETPIPMSAITEKCNIIAKSFLSSESVELLKTYIPTLKPENPYLFQSNTHKALDPETVGDILKGLARKAKIRIPKGKRLRFHCFRKRFLSTCADLKIDVNTAKLLVGKDVEKSMLTYLSEVAHKKAFEEVKTVLSLMNGKKTVIEAKDVEIEKLKKRNEELEAKILSLQLFMERTIPRKVIEETIVSMARDYNIPIQKEQTTDKKWHFPEPNKLNSFMKKLSDKLQEDKEQQEKKEYKRIIENGNGNNSH